MDIQDLVYNTESGVYFVFSKSDLLNDFIYTSIVRNNKVEDTNIVQVNSVKKFNTTTDTNRSKPLISPFWVYMLSDKAKLSKSSRKVLASNRFGVYIIPVSDYATMKKYQKAFKEVRGTHFLWLSYLNRRNIDFLYNEVVKVEGLTKRLRNKFFRDYNGDVDKVLNLFYKLNQGLEVSNYRQLVTICGVSRKTLDNLIFHLLKTPTYTTRGLKNYISKLVQDGTELANQYNYLGLQSILQRRALEILEVKEYIRSNRMNYSRVIDTNDDRVKDIYKKYRSHVVEIKEIPLSRVTILLRVLMDRKMYSSDEFLLFCYNFVLQKALSQKEAVLEGIEKERQSELRKQKRREEKLSKVSDNLKNKEKEVKKEGKKKAISNKNKDVIESTLSDEEYDAFITDTVSNMLLFE